MKKISLLGIYSLVNSNAPGLFRLCRDSDKIDRSKREIKLRFGRRFRQRNFKGLTGTIHGVLVVNEWPSFAVMDFLDLCFIFI